MCNREGDRTGVLRRLFQPLNTPFSTTTDQPKRDGLSVIPLVAACAILVCYTVFWKTLSKRYRGPSMVLMEAGYLFGQIIVCAMVGWLSWWLFSGGV